MNPLRYLAINDTIKFDEIYKCPPFDAHLRWRYPGYVIRCSLTLLDTLTAQSNLEELCGGSAQWWKFKTQILDKLLFAITADVAKTFSPIDCAISLLYIAVMVRQDCYDVRIAGLRSAVASLLKHFQKTLPRATTKNISMVLKALGEIVSAGKDISVDAAMLKNQIFALYEKRTQATLMEIGNALWGIAKWIEADKDIDIDLAFIEGLIKELHEKRVDPDPEAFAKSVWAYGIIFNRINPDRRVSELVAEFVKDSFVESMEHPVTLLAKKQMLTGIYLLGLEKTPEMQLQLKALIEECRPSSKLNKQRISAILKKKYNLVFQEKDLELTRFIHGYYVSCLVTEGTEKVIEITDLFDYSQHPGRKISMQYRNKYILTGENYPILRINLSNPMENSHKGFFSATSEAGKEHSSDHLLQNNSDILKTY